MLLVHVREDGDGLGLEVGGDLLLVDRQGGEGDPLGWTKVFA